MNTKLVESLAEAIVALPQEDYALFQETITDRMIRKTPHVAGGVACVRNTRIAVWTLISLINQGADEKEISVEFPGLTRFDLIATQAYYQINQSEIDNLIASHQQVEEEDGWVICQ